MKEPIDWIRAVFFGGISGGLLWAVMLAVLFPATRGHTAMGDLYTILTAISVGILVIGILVYRRATTSVWRSTAIGIILAPLTGWSILLVITLAVVLPKQGMF